MSADRIRLGGIAAETLIGVFEHERHAKRPILVDLDLRCDLAAAGATDRVEDTVDYFALTARVRERCAAASYRLLEALAEDLARVCLSDARVAAATVTIRKPGAVAGVADIAVAVTRTR